MPETKEPINNEEASRTEREHEEEIRRHRTDAEHHLNQMRITEEAARRWREATERARRNRNDNNER